MHSAQDFLIPRRGLTVRSLLPDATGLPEVSYAPVLQGNQVATRSCSKCHKNLSGTASVCKYCQEIPADGPFVDVLQDGRTFTRRGRTSRSSRAVPAASPAAQAAAKAFVLPELYPNSLLHEWTREPEGGQTLEEQDVPASDAEGVPAPIALTEGALDGHRLVLGGALALSICILVGLVATALVRTMRHPQEQVTMELHGSRGSGGLSGPSMLPLPDERSLAPGGRGRSAEDKQTVAPEGPRTEEAALGTLPQQDDKALLSTRGRRGEEVSRIQGHKVWEPAAAKSRSGILLQEPGKVNGRQRKQHVTAPVANSSAELPAQLGAQAPGEGHAEARCRTAMIGDKCHKTVLWAMQHGIYSHPEWYASLTPSSAFTDFQRKLAGDGQCPVPCGEPCLCLFDVDLTLTSRPGPGACPGSAEIQGVNDSAQGGRNLVLSPLGMLVERTFCSRCYRGAIASSNMSELDERGVIVNVLGGFAPTLNGIWSLASNLSSILVTGARDGEKHVVVQNMLSWLRAQHGVIIEDAHVHFFDDDARNVAPFTRTKFNARQVSCALRQQGSGAAPCGATLQEVVEGVGVQMCDGAVEINVQ